MPQIGATVSDEIKEVIQEMADAYERSFSEMVRFLLKDALFDKRALKVVKGEIVKSGDWNTSKNKS